MKKKIFTAKTKKKIRKSLIPGATLLSLFLALYMVYVSPTRKDIQDIKNLVGTHSGRIQESSPIWIPEGNIKIDKAGIDKLEKDIKKVESSVFFSLSSQTYLDIAVFYFDHPNFTKALEYVDKSIKKDPRNSKSLMLRSILKFYAGSLPAALSDINVVIEVNPDGKIRASAQIVKGYISLLSGDLQTSKDSFVKAADFFSFPGESKVLLLFSCYLLSSACFDLGEYDTGDYYFSIVKEVSKQLESAEEKDTLAVIMLALANTEDDLKSILDNYDKLVKLSDDNVFLELIIYLYKASISFNDFEAFSSYLESAIQFSKKYEITFLQQLFTELLFESWLDDKKSFRKDLWEEIAASPAKIPTLEADMYYAAGKFYQEQKDNESALKYLNIALELYAFFGKKREIIDTKVNIYFAQSGLKDYYSSTKMLRSALDDINWLLRYNTRGSYVSKRAKKEIGLLRTHKEGIENLLPIMDKLLR